MPTKINLTLAGELMIATARRALVWPATRTLLIADLHAGKAGHFRRHGLALPGDLLGTDLARVDKLIDEFEITRIIFLGDLFHSTRNSEWEQLVAWRTSHDDVSYVLVRGNHDRFMKDAELIEGGFEVIAERMYEGPFSLTHAPEKPDEAGVYNIAGHLHPGIILREGIHGSLRRPIYWFGPTQGVLPAFGTFTGQMKVKPEKSDQVFVVGDEQILEWKR